MGKYGFSFSWKRALGITAAKQKFARETGIPTSVNGIERKVGRSVIKWTGWTLFILLMIPFMLILIAEPSFDNDCHPYVWEKGLVYTWLGSLLFSVLLIIVGKYHRKHKP